jgi:hypothetical protein
MQVSQIIQTLASLCQQGFIKADLNFFTEAEVSDSHEFYALYVGMLLRGAEESDAELIEDALCVMGYRFELPITDGPKIDEIEGLA